MLAQAQPPYARKSGDYSCVDLLGKGSYGTCYKVIHKHLGQPCVMKVIPLQGLSEKDVTNAFSEASLLSKISHPHVVSYLDAWIENSHLYIVMEHCTGGDLSARLKAGRMCEADVWKCARDISCGMQHLHERRIMHRDIKPSNLFFSNHKMVIGDFGLGRHLAPFSLARTQVGTPLYFSPEVCQARPYGFASDVWAYGCVLYEMITGEPPYAADSQIALAEKICRREPAPLPTSCSTGLQRLVACSLDKDPQRRPSMLECFQVASTFCCSTLLHTVRGHRPLLPKMLSSISLADDAGAGALPDEQQHTSNTPALEGAAADRPRELVPHSLEVGLLRTAAKCVHCEQLQGQVAFMSTKIASLERLLASATQRAEEERRASAELQRQQTALQDKLRLVCGGPPDGTDSDRPRVHMQVRSTDTLQKVQNSDLVAPHQLERQGLGAEATADVERDSTAMDRRIKAVDTSVVASPPDGPAARPTAMQGAVGSRHSTAPGVLASTEAGDDTSPCAMQPTQPAAGCIGLRVPACVASGRRGTSPGAHTAAPAAEPGAHVDSTHTPACSPNRIEAPPTETTVLGAGRLQGLRRGGPGLRGPAELDGEPSVCSDAVQQRPVKHHRLPTTRTQAATQEPSRAHAQPRAPLQLQPPAHIPVPPRAACGAVGSGSTSPEEQPAWVAAMGGGPPAVAGDALAVGGCTTVTRCKPRTAGSRRDLRPAGPPVSANDRQPGPCAPAAQAGAATERCEDLQPAGAAHATMPNAEAAPAWAPPSNGPLNFEVWISNASALPTRQHAPQANGAPGAPVAAGRLVLAPPALVSAAQLPEKGTGAGQEPGVDSMHGCDEQVSPPRIPPAACKATPQTPVTPHPHARVAATDARQQVDCCHETPAQPREGARGQPPASAPSKLAAGQGAALAGQLPRASCVRRLRMPPKSQTPVTGADEAQAACPNLLLASPMGRAKALACYTPTPKPSPARGVACLLGVPRSAPPASLAAYSAQLPADAQRGLPKWDGLGQQGRPISQHRHVCAANTLQPRKSGGNGPKTSHGALADLYPSHAKLSEQGFMCGGELRGRLQKPGRQPLQRVLHFEGNVQVAVGNPGVCEFDVK